MVAAIKWLRKDERAGRKQLEKLRELTFAHHCYYDLLPSMHRKVGPGRDSLSRWVAKLAAMKSRQNMIRVVLIFYFTHCVIPWRQ